MLRIKKWLLSILMLCTMALHAAAGQNPPPGDQGTTHISGEGAGFALPLMNLWSKTYFKQNDAHIFYSVVDNDPAYENFKNNKIDYLITQDVSQLGFSLLRKNHWQLKRLFSRPVVVIVNIPGVKDDALILDPASLADIYLGKILYWDDEKIKRFNPKLNLPHSRIISVYTSEDMGEAYAFAKFLSTYNNDWLNSVGAKYKFTSLAAYSLEANSMLEVKLIVSQTPNAIGFAPYVSGKMTSLTEVGLRIKGRVYLPIKKALMNCNPAKVACWPINSYAYLLSSNVSKHHRQLVQFMDWLRRDKRAKADALSLGFTLYR